MLRFFKSNNQLVTFLIPVIGLILWLPVFFNQVDLLYFNPELSPVLQLFTQPAYSLIKSIVSFLLLILLAFYLVRLNTKFVFIRFRTVLPALMLVLLLSPLSYSIDLFPVLLVAFPVLLAIERTFDSFSHDNLAFEFIDASFLISLASLFFLPALIGHILIWIILLMLKNNTWREWVFTLIGGIMPFLIYFTFHYFFDWQYSIKLHKMFSGGIPFLLPQYLGNIFLLFVAILVGIGSIQMIKVFGVKKIQSRKLFLSLFGLFVFGLVLLLFPPVRVFGYAFALIPSAYLTAHFFHLVKSKRLGEILFDFLFLLSFLECIFMLWKPAFLVF